MEMKEIIESISKRGNGSIYLGVVGAVRTGKSTFIKKVIENLVVPNIEDEYEKKKCLDEIPQSSNGKQIMTTEPKFVPSNGATIKIDDFTTNIKLIDCVGFVIDNSIGYEDNEGNPRLVNTPWYSEAIPFIEAAEIGTEKVIKDHSTIGIVLTSDGSFNEFRRNDYVDAEEKVINELKTLNKPFIVILNTTSPTDTQTLKIKAEIEEKYGVEVIPMNVENMGKREINDILKLAVDEFPVVDVNVLLPEWIHVLSNKNEIKAHYLDKIRESVVNINKIKDVGNIINYYQDSPYIKRAYISNVDIGSGIVSLNLESSDDLYDETLKNILGGSDISKATILKILSDYEESREETHSLQDALKMTYKTGYGIVYPSLKDMKLEKPEIIKQGSRYGVRLNAKATSIHMMKVDVESTFEPIIGSEVQSKELIDYIMKDYNVDPSSIWKSEIFGRSLDNIVKEGIQAKLSMMKDNTRYKLTTTVGKIVNKGTDKLIAIVL
ncbi:MAG: stage IV sporulation protein A [Bacilli bacterium]|nr:stage IV sporulation protein A [Bacilli bacterium]